MIWKIQENELKLSGNVSIEHLEQIHESFDKSVKAIDLSEVTQIDFAVLQWFYIVRLIFPTIHWYLPKQEIKEIIVETLQLTFYEKKLGEQS